MTDSGKMGNPDDAHGDGPNTTNKVGGRVKGAVIQSGNIDSVTISPSPVRPWVVWTALGAAVAIVAALVFIVYPRNNVVTSPPPTQNPAPKNAATTVNGPLAVNPEWPVARGCPAHRRWSCHRANPRSPAFPPTLPTPDSR